MTLRERMNLATTSNKARSTTTNVGVNEPVLIERNLLIENGISQSITLNQFDTNSYLIRFTLLIRDKTPLNLEDCEVMLVMKNPHETYHKMVGNVVDTSEGIVEFLLDSQCSLVEGSTKCQIVKTWGKDNILSFPIFTFTVVESLYDKHILEKTTGTNNAQGVTRWQL